MQTKEYTFIKKNGQSVRGRMLFPKGADEHEKNLTVLIFSHGFGGNFRNLIDYGKRFSMSGICCFLYDFCGGGPESSSDGTMLEMTVRTEAEDLKTVIEGIRSLPYADPEKIFLLGESQGGYVSALTAGEIPEKIHGLVLWYPAFVLQDDAIQTVAEGKADGDERFGLPISGEFIKTAVDTDIYHILAGYRKKVKILHGDQDEIVPLSYSRKALLYYDNAELQVIEGAGHGFAGEEQTAAIEATIAYIRSME